MFGVPIEKIKKGNPEYELRQKGKVAELALGYQGGPGALIQMGALDKGLTEAELPEIVQRWRNSNKRIVDLWHTIQNCAINCLKTGQTQVMQKNIYFSFENGNLAITLPSKRQLFYIKPKLEINQFGSEAISYMGQNQTTKTWWAGRSCCRRRRPRSGARRARADASADKTRRRGRPRVRAVAAAAGRSHGRPRPASTGRRRR